MTDKQTGDIYPMDRPFFIVSSGRSGTTLLSALLNASSQVCIPPESDFIARAFPFFHHKYRYMEKDYQELINLFCNTSQMKGWNLNPTTLLKRLNSENPQSFADINTSFYKAYLEEKGLLHLQWGIKSPVLIADIP